MHPQAIKIKDQFHLAYDYWPDLIVRSPGRVNLIGEHTDYNKGFVLPAAVDKAIWFAISPRSDRHARLHAADLVQKAEIDLDRLQKSPQQWPDYLSGIVSVLKSDNRNVRGFDVAFGGDLPRASGMSSSAALECGLTVALDKLFDLGLGRRTMALLAQKAENSFVGVHCGIMDQFANLFGKYGHVLHIDCRSLEHATIPFSRSDLRLVLCDTRIRRKLAGSEYNVRRSQCESGVAALQLQDSTIRSLRDVTIELLLSKRTEMEPLIFRRCLYVVEENQRVTDACKALKKNDFEALGRLLNASHAGLRDLYEVSCRELDLLVDTARTIPGVLGSRMMGAGFGGCTINLMEEEAVETFQKQTVDAFTKEFGQEPGIHTCQIEEGTAIVS